MGIGKKKQKAKATALFVLENDLGSRLAQNLTFGLSTLKQFGRASIELHGIF